MERNKENEKSIGIKLTKIPIPVQPLPQIPATLLTSFSKCGREPLKTLNSQTQGGITKSKIDPVCTKNVTVRHPGSAFDWQNKVFRDKREKRTEGKLNAKLQKDLESERNSKKESNIVCKKDVFGVEECVLLNLADQPVTSTPYVASYLCLEPARIRNIKKSLKRPHSRELQCFSPTKKENKRIINVRSKLNYGDRIVDRLDIPDDITKQYTVSYCKVYTKDFIQYLIANERKPVGLPQLPNITRTCIVNWIFKINGEDGDPSVSQAACWYLDSLSSIAEIKLEHLQVTAAACYWIAQKLYGPNVTANRLIKNGGNSYTDSQLRRAERKVLSILKFPPLPVVAQEYICYLSWWCDSENPGVIEVGSSFLCLCGLLVDKTLACEYPSVLAAAAVQNVICLLDKTELMPRLMSNSLFSSALKKSSDFAAVCLSLRSSVSIVGHPCSEYRAPYDHYCRPPHMLAKKILEAVKNCAAFNYSVNNG